MNLLLIGAQGSGKGTQAQLLQQELTLTSVASGELLREEMAQGTPDGEAARPYYERGDLVPDSIIIGMILHRMNHLEGSGGIILDGFPRNLAQAHALDALLSELGQPLDAVVQMDVDYGELMRRISGRRTCGDCGRVFNLFSTPADQIETEKCPKTGEPHKLCDSIVGI